MEAPLVGIIMGSKSDKDVMDAAAKELERLGVKYEMRIVSAHRTPDVMDEYASSAKERGLKVIIAGAGGSAHLPGMTASHPALPVIAGPLKWNPHDHEALWSNIKMPPGVPLATMPENGAKNAALMAVEILAVEDPALSEIYAAYRKDMHDEVIADDEEMNK
jgi:5-(carboxyamino)imidazole ribonucleotide mutase